MKTRFNTYDIVCSIHELQRLIGMRVQNIYDIDNKTYLIKLQRGEEKAVLLLESGNRFHSTVFEWPKSVAPSGFSMKMRKHLKNKRLESLKQLGVDRIVILQFGTNEAAYYLILELFDRGNIILLDYELTILYVLRPHTEGEVVRFAVREKYPLDRAHMSSFPSVEKIKEVIAASNPKDGLKKILNPHLEYGPAILEHVLLKFNYKPNEAFLKNYDLEKEIDNLMEALKEAENILNNGKLQNSKGYIIQKQEERPSQDGEKQYFFSNQEFHPMIFLQHKNAPFKEFDSFDCAVDEFFSSLEGQKIDIKALQQEREALKKLENVRKDHVQRLDALEKTQVEDKEKAELITRNQDLVEKAIGAIQSALANQMPWPDIEELVKAAQARDDPVAGYIKELKLEKNHITLLLSDPYYSEDSNEENQSDGLKPTLIDIDLALSAFANARRYYDQKRSAAKKQQKTIESQFKALKSAEKKTKQTLKEVQAMTNINKARKVFWFEKFFWFISSENYLVIGGRDQQQNEILVKRYMRQNDVYVHADLHGASSVVIKNNSDQPIPPKTLNEAGTMATCYSVAWDAKVVTNAWWVNANQVSKTAPTGEYLTTGSFMVRGKKNYLPPCHLIMGFSFLFKLEDGSVERHKDDRKVRSGALEEIKEEDGKDDVELEVIDESEDEEKDAEEPKVDSDSESSDDGKPRFPNTKIRLERSSDNKISVVAQLDETFVRPVAKEDTVVYLGDDKPVLLTNQGQRSRNPSEYKNKQKKSGPKEVEAKEEEKKSNQLKRGQKGKLKKTKKYKDQDEEERNAKMQMLQSAGNEKPLKKGKKGSKESSKKEVRKPVPRPDVQKVQIEGEDDDADVQVTTDTDMIDSLTGQPVLEDELLFAIPVVAPYNTLTNYKFKVKLTPGTNRRGKAARTAVAMFAKDRSTTPREKDLLRSVKDELLARNLPGKVKLSAPKLMTGKK